MWHILKKTPEKFKGYKEYKSIKFFLKNVVYDSLTTEEFEERWGRFIEKYHLESHEWLLELYNERYYWVPAFVKDTFWAGMSTAQQSESINAFFDGYVHHQTTLKEFVEQYDKALAKNAANENTKDFNSFQFISIVHTMFYSLCYGETISKCLPNSKIQRVSKRIVREGLL